MPLRVATPTRTVACPSQLVAPATATPHTGWLDPNGIIVFQFFVVDLKMVCNPMDGNSDSDDNECTKNR